MFVNPNRVAAEEQFRQACKEVNEKIKVSLAINPMMFSDSIRKATEEIQEFEKRLQALRPMSREYKAVLKAIHSGRPRAPRLVYDLWSEGDIEAAEFAAKHGCAPPGYWLRRTERSFKDFNFKIVKVLAEFEKEQFKQACEDLERVEAKIADWKRRWAV